MFLFLVLVCLCLIFNLIIESCWTTMCPFFIYFQDQQELEHQDQESTQKVVVPVKKKNISTIQTRNLSFGQEKYQETCSSSKTKLQPLPICALPHDDHRDDLPQEFIEVEDHQIQFQKDKEQEVLDDLVEEQTRYRC